MKALLVCPPESPAVPLLAESGPLATIPVFGECIASHWIEHLAALGAREIVIAAGKSAERVRAAVGDGARWGVRLNVVASGPDPAPGEASCPGVFSMSRLPGCPGLPLFESYASWFAALLAWMPRALTPARVRMALARPAIWVGGRARVSPKAELIAPCWIGDLAFVEDGAIIGPGAIIDDRTVVDEKAHVTRSWVAADTFVGPMTSVANSLAWGSTLINWQTDSSLNVPDPFLLSSLARHAPAAEPLHAAGVREHSGSHLGALTGLRARLSRGPT